ncbi:MAG: GAF domain-containing sensor histidine kinase [Chloroflexi bacterium]|nr:GAF domain-containing sensor histidine kinase [Chloroflexota bacterium]MBI5081315.1 GAF domain-containing sensor histidine kinase [Chloroflexota bacterium]
MNSQLHELREAVLAISSDLSLPEVLQRIVTAAATLTNAKYAAIGVPDDSGKLLGEFVVHGISEEERKRIAHPPRGLGVLGVIMSERKRMRLRNITDHPRSTGFPMGHPPMGSFLGMPILLKDRCLGSLYITNKIGADEFTSDDEQLIEWLASHAAIAIEHARLYEEVQRLSIVEERQRIGMDLHDGVIQSIYAVGLQLEFIRALIEDGDSKQAHDRLGAAIEALNHTIRDIRSYILDLHPHQFQGDDLEVGVRRLVAEFKANSLIVTDLEIDSDVCQAVSPEARLAIFQITQEALANVAKHSHATRVKLQIFPNGESLKMSVEDNGVGLPLDGGVRRMGHGLNNMAQRARTIGGALEVNSEQGNGTRIDVRVPKV